jgi:membrane associated rhomboid family serine protease
VAWPQRAQLRFGSGWTRGMTALIVANCALWLLEVLALRGGGAAADAVRGAMLEPDRVFGGLRLWQLVTYQLLHDPQDPLHLLFNMLVLYSFGGLFERRWGTRDFLRFYLICGCAAGAVGALAAWVAPGLFGAGPIVGASGALAGLLMAFALIFPGQRVSIMMLATVQARQLVYAAVAIDAILFLTGSHVAVMVHAGGFLTGWLLVTGRWRPASWRGWWGRLQHWRRRRRFAVYGRPS